MSAGWSRASSSSANATEDVDPFASDPSQALLRPLLLERVTAEADAELQGVPKLSLGLAG
jgi:hypothetical protein